MALEDTVYRAKQLYTRAPGCIRWLAGTAYSLLPMRIRYGRVVGECQALLAESQWWTRERHLQYQLQRMRCLLRHVSETVPYYRRMLRRLGMAAEDVTCPDDWAKLPLIDKAIVREHREELIAENMKNRLLPVTTGGSSGEPLHLFLEKGRTRALERAFMWRQWGWAGFRVGERTAVIRGHAIPEGLWRREPIDNQLIVNSFALTEENCEQVFEELQRFRPTSIQGYPTSLLILAGWMKRNRPGAIPSLKVLLCGSENLLPTQKRVLEQTFRCRAYNWYGHTEACCLAGYCDKADHYHVYSEYGYAELIDPEGRSLPWEDGQKGEIVATSFINDAMPLIRYRTGDVAIAGPETCVCGRSYPLLRRIEGREHDYVIAADGHRMALGFLYGGHWAALGRIRQVQFEQRVPGHMIVRLAVVPSFSQRDEREIRDAIGRRVGTSITFQFEYVDQIPLTARGKHVLLKQWLTLQDQRTAHGG